MRALFERRHYTRLAEAIAAAKRDGKSVDDLQRDLADLFARDNPNFQKATWTRFCNAEARS